MLVFPFRLEIPRTPSDQNEESVRSGEILLMALGVCTAGTLRGRTSIARMSVKSLRITLEAERVARPSRYDNILMSIEIDGDLSEAERETVLRVAGACTIGNTLRAGADVRVGISESCGASREEIPSEDGKGPISAG